MGKFKRDKFTKRKNYLLTKDDIEQIENVIKYATGLIILNKPLADKEDDRESMKAASDYIKARLKTDDKTEYERNLIIKNYQEKNPYYKDLYKKYGIDILEARTGVDFQLLKSKYNCLDDYNKDEFERSYYEALKYHQMVTYTKAFKNQSYEREFQEIYLVNDAVQRYINKKLEDFFNYNTYNKSQLKNAFISYGFDYFDSFPLQYQRKVLKSIEKLIRDKGSDNVFSDILNIFGFNNIDIYKYYLAKDPEAPSGLSFYKNSYKDKLNFLNSEKISYDAITNADGFWKSSSEEILNQDFNISNTKYISIESSMDIFKNTYNLAYFVSLLYKIEEDRKNIKDREKLENEKKYIDFSFINSHISSQPIELFDSIMTLIALLLKYYGFKDNFSTNIDSMHYIYSYGNIENNVDVKEFLETLQTLFDNHKINCQLSEDEKYNLQTFINRFRLKNFSYKTSIDYEEIMSEFYSDSKYRESLLRFIKRFKKQENPLESNRDLYSLDKYQYRTSVNLYNHMMEYYEKDEIYRLYDYIINAFYNDRVLNDKNHTKYQLPLAWMYGDDVKDCFYILKKIIYFKIMKGDLTLEQLHNAFFMYRTQSTEELIAYIETFNPSETKDIQIALKRYKEYNDVLSLSYLTYTIYEYVTNKKTSGDVFFADKIENFRNYKVARDIVLNFEEYSLQDHYNISDLLEVLNYNEDLRTSLENFIMKTNNYKLYQSYNQIWKIKYTGDSMKTFFDTDKYPTISSYLKSVNEDLYFYINDFRSEGLHTDLDKHLVIKDRIFELCQSLDNFINTSNNFIIDNNYVGIISYIKKFISILIKIFKAYTLQDLNVNTKYLFNDKINNSVRMFDDIDFKGDPIYDEFGNIIGYNYGIHRSMLDTTSLYDVLNKNKYNKRIYIYRYIVENEQETTDLVIDENFEINSGNLSSNTKTLCIANLIPNNPPEDYESKTVPINKTLKIGNTTFKIVRNDEYHTIEDLTITSYPDSYVYFDMDYDNKELFYVKSVLKNEPCYHYTTNENFNETGYEKLDYISMEIPESYKKPYHTKYFINKDISTQSKFLKLFRYKKFNEENVELELHSYLVYILGEQPGTEEDDLESNKPHHDKNQKEKNRVIVLAKDEKVLTADITADSNDYVVLEYKYDVEKNQYKLKDLDNLDPLLDVSVYGNFFDINYLEMENQNPNEGEGE